MIIIVIIKAIFWHGYMLVSHSKIVKVFGHIVCTRALDIYTNCDNVQYEESKEEGAMPRKRTQIFVEIEPFEERRIVGPKKCYVVKRNENSYSRRVLSGCRLSYKVNVLYKQQCQTSRCLQYRSKQIRLIVGLQTHTCV